MGLKGRYVFIGLGALIGSILLFTITFIAFGFLTALISLLIGISTTSYWIYKRQSKGLHSKKCPKGVFIINSIITWK